MFWKSIYILTHHNATANGCGIIVCSPLAQGVLTDKYLEGIPADSRVAIDGRFLHKEDVTGKRMEKIEEICREAVTRGR